MKSKYRALWFAALLPVVACSSATPEGTTERTGESVAALSTCTLGMMNVGGGPVLHTPRIHYIPWVPTGWSGGSQPNYTVLQALARDFLMLPLAQVLSEYPDSTGSGVTNVSFSEQHTLTQAYPAAGTQANPLMGAQITAAIDSDPLNTSTNINDVYVVFFPSNVQVCSDSTDCSFPGPGKVIGGWHNKTPGGRTYAVILGSATPATLYTPNGLVTDSYANGLSHELFESFTDPHVNAWQDPGCGSNEIGDMCANFSGVVETVWDSSGSYTFSLQSEYSNKVSSCFDDTFNDEPPISTVSWGVNRLDSFIRGSDGAVWHKSWSGNQWNPSYSTWESLGGSMAGSPEAVSWGANRLDIFARGTAGDLQHKSWDGTKWNPSYTTWESLGGAITNHPTAVSWGANRLDIFAAGADGTMQHKSWDGTKWNPSYSTLESLGLPTGTGTTFPPNSGVKAVAWGPNRLDAFGTSSDGTLNHKYWDGTQWQPSYSTWENLGGAIGGTPAVASLAVNSLDVFVGTPGTSYELYHKRWNGSSWSSSWDDLGGPIAGSPGVAVIAPNELEVFVIGANDRALYYKSLTGTTWSPSMTGFLSPDGTSPNLGGLVSGSPSVVSWTTNRLDIFVPGPDVAIWHKSWTAGGPNYGWAPGPTQWESLGGYSTW